MALPDSFMEELKMRSDIVDVVSRYVSLKRQGRNMVGLCPFHGEKTPSFNVYPNSSSFYCFGCGVGGDVITFIRMIENLDYIESVKFLAQKAGIDVPIDNREDTLSKLKKRLYEANREAARFFYKNLLASSNEGFTYLKKRGLTDATIKHFGLGFSQDNRFSLVNYLRKKGFTDEELLGANLAIKSRNGYLIDRFYNRVMFPIIDLRGNVIAFGGRVMGDTKPKYLNTSDTAVFKKHFNLFALNFAKNHAKGQLILAEGYMDVIALHQAGFENAVATLGTSLTKEQVNIISRYCTEVVIAYDADSAGQTATQRAISMFRNTGVMVRVITIPNGKDPDEFIKSYGDDGPLRFKQLIEKSANDIEYSLRKIRLNYDIDSAQGRIKYLKDAVELLSELDNKIETEVYAGRLSQELNIEKVSLMLQIEKVRKRKQKKEQNKNFKNIQMELSSVRDDVNPDRGKNLRAAYAEEALIAYLLNKPAFSDDVFKRLSPDSFCTEFNKRIYRAIFERIKNNMPVCITDLSSEFSVTEISRIAKILSSFVETENEQETINEYINVILYEKENLSKEQIKDADIEDIRKYVDKLRELKK